MKNNKELLNAALFASVLALGANGYVMGQPAPVEELRPGMLIGYLTPEELPHALSIIPPAPEPDSPAFAWEQAVNQNMLALRDTPRWDLATLDNDLSFPTAAGTFSCALDMPINEQDTPYLYQLLRRTIPDAGLATYSAKDHYQRTRPFVVNGQPICVEGQEERLASDGSYPSGHTAIGWAWALILSELAPERGDAIAQRGLAFGDSRMVCNVHWPMDVIQGQIVAAATVARLQANATFREDMAGAAREIEQFSGKGLGTNRDCEAEAAALQIAVER
ncbi:phosphatase PAP2 family protein [Pseudohongiella sp. SYSU M77423]|uniref:acid phosphatase n=1 Tax=Pseudohongiella sp. SYSU M77423 TaxID=3042312 RepID=UPI002480C53B|nr:phosphatase PAP2 family protein [Pseudohongiella sp. SYSU M77423]MDH7942944.1 phosphatase PAP2 family protein [Pseudohongiella sp. SYSU M77423]